MRSRIREYISVVTRLRLRHIVGLALCLPLACDEGTGPEERLRGTFDLVSVDGEPVPALVESGSEYEYWMVSEELTFIGVGIGLVARAGVVRETTLSDGVLEERIYGGRLAYWIEGDSIEIGWRGSCNDASACVGNDMGTWSPQTLTIRRWGLGGRVLQYRRR